MRERNRFTVLLIHVFILSTFLLNNTIINGSNSVNYVLITRLNGGLYYGSEILIDEAINTAEKMNAPLILIIDTPGGLLSVTEEIVKRIRQSNIPVIGYVYPPGSRAWSAGSIVLMATHIAAMAPGTVTGAAQPMIYDPVTGQYRVVNESKIINPIIKILVSLAEDRGRNKTVAEKIVRENLSLDDREAKEYGFIEIIARNLDELLVKINGYVVKLDNGKSYIINTSRYVVIEYNGSLRVHLTKAISEPIVNSLISTISVLMLLFSLFSGNYSLIPLSLGLLVLSLIGSGFSTNLMSLILLIIGSTALAIELITPGFGILGFTGIMLITLSISLLPVINPGYLISPSYQAVLFWIGVSIGTGMGLFMSFVVYKVIKIRKQPLKIKTSVEGYIGKAIDNIPRGGTGFIIINGEYWRAIGLEDISIGDKVIVVGKNGYMLKVRKYKGDDSE
ncbi:MAG: nodulation protein NfeD [Desulfurococcaceae archaeon]